MDENDIKFVNLSHGLFNSEPIKSRQSIES